MEVKTLSKEVGGIEEGRVDFEVLPPLHHPYPTSHTPRAGTTTTSTGHVNNVEYYAFFDTVINRWLIREGGLDIHAGERDRPCAESHCTSTRRARVPRDVEAGCASASSATRASATRSACSRRVEDPVASGWFVHVFVDRASAPPGGAWSRCATPRAPRGSGMRVRGAVLREMGLPPPYAESRPLEIVELELDPPGPASSSSASARPGCATPTSR